MQIPVNKDIGYATVSPSMLRVYGAGGLILDEQEEERGCPRQYKAKYVEKRVPEQKSDALKFGSFFHDVLFRMEEDGLTPEEAMNQCFPADMSPEMWQEALDDLKAYLERGSSPMDQYATLGVETDLNALLYVDEDFGPIYLRGIIDHIGIDPDDSNTIHSTDYKSNRRPAKDSDLAGDIQLKAYVYLILKNWKRFAQTPNLRVISHLDLVKYRDYEWRFTPADIEAFRGWAEAVTRAILRDTEALPVLNSGCGWCPVQGDCPLIESLPDTAETLLAMKPETREEKFAWREKANALRLLLEKRVKKVDAELRDQVKFGSFVVGGKRFAEESDFTDQIDLRALHEALGDDVFYSIANVSKAAIERETKDWAPSALAPVKAAITRVINGTKLTKKKVD